MTAGIKASADGLSGELLVGGVVAASFNANGISKVQDAVVSAGKLNGGQTGSAPVYGARAWCTFSGFATGTNAPQAGGNVATVQRTAVGTYLVTFVTAMPDASFAVVPNSSGGQAYYGTRTANSVYVLCVIPTTGAPVDVDSLSVAIFK